MKAPAIRKFVCTGSARHPERGITMVLVAVAMVAIIAMAALSIDVVTLFLAREEAQRSADAAALAAARVLSISGITGDPSNSTLSWSAICGGTTSPATLAATAVGMRSAVGGATATITVSYSAGSGLTSDSKADCGSLGAAFGVNPMVTVQVKRLSLPTFFSRAWGNTGNSVSATATAEAFNPSNSGNVDNGPTGTLTPVQPRCVKPWFVPNRDPLYPNSTCDQGGGPCATFVSTADGSITHPGMSWGAANGSGVIGERFWLSPDCRHTGTSCTLRSPAPLGNYYPLAIQPYLQPPPSMQYLPGESPIVVPVAVPSCASRGSVYEEAIAGCDQSTVYQCGVQSSSSSLPNLIDLSENPGAGTDDTMNGVTCMIHEGDATDTQPDGQDTLSPRSSGYPFQILSGTSNPVLGSGLANTPTTSSPSIVSLPIYDNGSVTINPNGTTAVTVVGFLQVFINSADQWGNVDITVLNVAGCSNGAGFVGPAVTGSSPVPIRLITPP